MRMEIARKSKEEMLRFYHKPMSLKDWYVAISEVANGCWKAEAGDVWGRKIGRSGNDPDELIKQLEFEIEREFRPLNAK